MKKKKLEIRLPGDPWAADIVEARLLTEGMEFVSEAFLTPNKPAVVEVDPGAYVLETRRLGGESVFQTFTIGAEPKQVEVAEPQGEAMSPASGYSPRRLMQKSLAREVSAWIRIWSPSEDRWVALAHSDSENGVRVHIENDRLSFVLDEAYFRGSRIQILEVGRKDFGRRWFSLPAFRQGSTIVLTGAALIQKGRIGSPLIYTPKTELNILLHLLADPAPGAPEQLWNVLSEQSSSLKQDQDLIQHAEEYLREKVHDPLGAAAGALFLVRFGMFEKLHGWARNLADWFPWLADGAAVWSAQLLRDAELHEHVPKWQTANSLGNKALGIETVFDAARAWMLHAVSIGPPVFAESVRQLMFGFDVLARRQSEQHTSEFMDSLNTVRQWDSDLRVGLLASASGLYDPWMEEDVDIPEGATMLEVSQSGRCLRLSSD